MNDTVNEGGNGIHHLHLGALLYMTALTVLKMSVSQSQLFPELRFTFLQLVVITSRQSVTAQVEEDSYQYGRQQQAETYRP